MSEKYFEQIEELTMLLLYLTSWNEEGYEYDENDNISKQQFRQSWKGYSFDALNSLTDKRMLYPTKNKNKSVTLTKEGEEYAKELLGKYGLLNKCLE